MKKCPDCGARIEDGLKRCPYCGGRIESGEKMD